MWTTGACTAPGGVYTTGPELHLDVTTLDRIVLHLDVSKPQGPESLQWLLEFDIADLILFSSLLFFFYIVKFNNAEEFPVFRKNGFYAGIERRNY